MWAIVAWPTFVWLNLYSVTDLNSEEGRPSTGGGPNILTIFPRLWHTACVKWWMLPMRGAWRIIAAAVLTISAAFTSGGAQAGKFKVLHSFCSSARDGCVPVSVLVMDQLGNFFGTTVFRGAAKVMGLSLNWYGRQMAT